MGGSSQKLGNLEHGAQPVLDSLESVLSGWLCFKPPSNSGGFSFFQAAGLVALRCWYLLLSFFLSVFIVYSGREGHSESDSFQGLPEVILSFFYFPACRSFLQDGMSSSRRKLTQHHCCLPWKRLGSSHLLSKPSSEYPFQKNCLVPLMLHYRPGQWTVVFCVKPKPL